MHGPCPAPPLLSPAEHLKPPPSPALQSGAIAEMVADGTSAGGGGDGLREETMLQQKLAAYATSIGRFGLGAAGLAFAAMTLRFRSVPVPPRG